MRAVGQVASSQATRATRADSALDKDEASGKANTPYYP
ncbi:hypothetical protein Tco_1180497, partial [Tanacetum coccineum]